MSPTESLNLIRTWLFEHACKYGMKKLMSVLMKHQENAPKLKCVDCAGIKCFPAFNPNYLVNVMCANLLETMRRILHKPLMLSALCTIDTEHLLTCADLLEFLYAQNQFFQFSVFQKLHSSLKILILLLNVAIGKDNKYMMKNLDVMFPRSSPARLSETTSQYKLSIDQAKSHQTKESKARMFFLRLLYSQGKRDKYVKNRLMPEAKVYLETIVELLPDMINLGIKPLIKTDTFIDKILLGKEKSIFEDTDPAVKILLEFLQPDVEEDDLITALSILDPCMSDSEFEPIAQDLGLTDTLMNDDSTPSLLLDEDSVPSPAALGETEPSRNAQDSVQNVNVEITVKPVAVKNIDLEKTVEPVSTESVDMEKTIEPISIKNVHVGKTIEPVSVKNVDMEKMVEPVSVKNVRVEKTVEPISEKNVNVEKTVEPASKKNINVEKTVEPASKKNINVEKTVEPVSKKNINVEKTVEPVSEKNMNVEKTVEPVSVGNVDPEKTVKPVSKQNSDQKKIVEPVETGMACLQAESISETTMDSSTRDTAVANGKSSRVLPETGNMAETDVDSNMNDTTMRNLDSSGSTISSEPENSGTEQVETPRKSRSAKLQATNSIRLSATTTKKRKAVTETTPTEHADNAAEGSSPSSAKKSNTESPDTSCMTNDTPVSSPGKTCVSKTSDDM